MSWFDKKGSATEMIMLQNREMEILRSYFIFYGVVLLLVSEPDSKLTFTPTPPFFYFLNFFFKKKREKLCDAVDRKENTIK